MKWAASPSFPDYEVSEYGQVRRIRSGIRGGIVGKVMMPFRRADGYNMYILRRDNRSWHMKAHQLVAEAYIGPKPFPGAEVCHEDGSRDNDHWTNLRWDTRKGNHADKVKHGTTSRGENHPAAKFTDEEVLEMRRLVGAGMLQREVGDKFGVSQAYISRIVSGDRWSYLR